MRRTVRTTAAACIFSALLILASALGMKMKFHVHTDYCRTDGSMSSINIPSRSCVVKMNFNSRGSPEMAPMCQWTMSIWADKGETWLLRPELRLLDTNGSVIMPGDVGSGQLKLTHSRNGSELSSYHWNDDPMRMIPVTRGDTLTISHQLAASTAPAANRYYLHISVVANQSCSDDGMQNVGNVCFAKHPPGYITSHQLNHSLITNGSHVMIGPALRQAFVKAATAFLSASRGPAAPEFLLGVSASRITDGQVLLWVPAYVARYPKDDSLQWQPASAASGQLTALVPPASTNAPWLFKRIDIDQAAKLPILTAVSVAFVGLDSCPAGLVDSDQVDACLLTPHEAFETSKFDQSTTVLVVVGAVVAVLLIVAALLIWLFRCKRGGYNHVPTGVALPH